MCLCYEVRATRSYGSGDFKYAFLGITEKGFWSQKEGIIGWYMHLNAINKEIKAVHSVMAAGETSYELQYFTPVEPKGKFGAPKIADSALGL